MHWNVFDPEAEVHESQRNLPHRDQTGALTFVTFRLGDSMPKEVIVRWQEEIAEALTQHGLAGQSLEVVLNSPDVPEKTKQFLRDHKSERWHFHLDSCHGECLLRQPSNAAEVSKSILHFNGDRYDVERFVVMPNHVHVLIQMRAGVELRKTFRELQRFSAREINKLMGRKGDLWQGEPFDHIVRSEAQFRHFQQYIFDNPQKAKLRIGEYLYWECKT